MTKLAEDFLSDVLPSNGHYAYFDRKNNHFVTNQKDLVKHLIQADEAGRDAYFATGSYLVKGSRKANNVDHKRSLYLDIDCGPGKPYADQKTGVAALIAFSRTVGMPPPTWIVSSGNGLQPHWCFDKSVNPSTWRKLADMLKSVCAAQKLHADPSVTSDLTRILRIPDTHNHKDANNPKPVKAIKTGNKYPVTRFDTLLRKHLTPGFRALHGMEQNLNAALSDNLYEKVPRFAAQIVTECDVLKDAVKTHGVKHTEPLWSSLLHLLAFCEDGEKFIHEIGSAHPGYTHASTVAKYNSKLAAIADNEALGPTTCAHIAQDSSLCATCPKQGTVKSPITVGKALADALELPTGYQQRADGIYAVEPDGGALHILPILIHRFGVFEPVGADGEMTLSMEWSYPGQPHRHFNPTLTVAQDPKSLRLVCSPNKLGLLPSHHMVLAGLMGSWAQALMQAGHTQAHSMQYGWTGESGKQGFAAGEYIFWDDKSKELTSVGSASIRELYKPRGDLEPWKRTAELVLRRNDMATTCAVASAFGAPLTKLLGIAGCAMSIVSEESGTGKSLALKVAAATWGCPNNTINALDDTPASVIERLSMLNNLPAYWDELRLEADVEKFISTVLFRLSQGKSKARLNSDAQLKATSTWNTLMCVASNEALRGHIKDTVTGSNAGLMRLLELHVTPLDKSINSMDGLQGAEQLESNYGVAGQMYAEYISAHHDYAKSRVLALMAYLNKFSHDEQPERFRIATAACLLIGAKLANDLGLTKFPLKDMLKYLIHALRYEIEGTDMPLQLSKTSPITQAARESMTTVNLNAVVKRFLEEKAAHIYTSEFVPFGRGRPSPKIPNSGYGVLHKIEIREPLMGVKGLKDGHLRIHLRFFTDFIKKQKFPTGLVKRKWKACPHIEKGQRKLGVGIIEDMKTKPVCLDIDLTKFNLDEE